MLGTPESVVLLVPDLKAAVAWYRLVLGIEPEVILDRSVSFFNGDDLNLILVDSDGVPNPNSAALICSDLEAVLSEWREYAGIVEMECLRPGWPMKFAILRDPGNNSLVVVEATQRQGSKQSGGNRGRCKIGDIVNNLASRKGDTIPETGL